MWTGRGFRVGDRDLPVLSYEPGESNWTDDLTAFHEDAAGGTHFIDVASRRHALRQVGAAARSGAPVILEVGCSSGFLLSALRAEHPHALVMGADVVLGPLLRLAKRNPEIPLLHFDLTRCPLPDGSVDVAVLLNVLEHIEDDALAVRQLYRILKPGGVAVIEVPAGPELYDVYDELLLHHRRYRSRDLRRLLLDANFVVLRESHLGFFLYPGFYLLKRLRRRNREHIAAQDIAAIVRQDIASSRGNPVLRALTRIEGALGEVLSYPFGIRCLATVRKPQGGAPTTRQGGPRP